MPDCRDLATLFCWPLTAFGHRAKQECALEEDAVTAFKPLIYSGPDAIAGPMTNPDRKTLDALSERIEKARADLNPPRKSSKLGEKYQGLTIAWRMTLEMALGVLFGLGIGHGLDRLLNTKPWLLIMFAFLGVAAGIKTVLRTAKELETRDNSK